MVQLGGTFDANSVEPSKSFDLLPAGWYAMQIVASEWKQTKAGGAYLQLDLEMLEQHHPSLKGRKLWARLNLNNANDQTVAIAQRDLSAICRSVGVTTVTDTQQLHNRPLAVKVKVRAASGEYEAQNEPSGYDALMARFAQGAAPAPTAPTSPAARPPATPTPGAPAPWARK